MTIQHRTVDIEAAAKLWRDDHSASQIAKRFGVSRNVIVGLAFRNAVCSRGAVMLGKRPAHPVQQIRHGVATRRRN